MSEVECSSFSLPLLLDASSPKVQVGVPSASEWRSLHCFEEPALTSLFTGARSCLKSVDAKADAIDAIFFCEGPGSTLGLRTALTFVKTLASQLATPPDVFIYNALDASSLLAANPDAPILAEYRQGQWYLRDSTGEIRVIEEAEALLSKTLRSLPEFESEFESEFAHTTVVHTTSTSAADLFAADVSAITTAITIAITP